jgi:hypothetical protein
MTRIWVDFNDRDRKGRVPAMVRDASDDVVFGDEVLAYDGDGNTCQGLVAESDGRYLSLEMKWGTFSASMVDANDLIEA